MHIAQAARLVDCAAEGEGEGDSSKVDSVAVAAFVIAALFVGGGGHSSGGDDD